MNKANVALHVACLCESLLTYAAFVRIRTEVGSFNMLH